MQPCQGTMCSHYNDSTWRQSSITFNLHSGWIWAGRLFPPSSPVLAETFRLWYERAQGVFLKTVRIFKGEPLSVFPLSEHQFHHIRGVETWKLQLNVPVRFCCFERVTVAQGEGKPTLNPNTLWGALQSPSRKPVFLENMYLGCQMEDLHMTVVQLIHAFRPQLLETRRGLVLEKIDTTHC